MTVTASGGVPPVLKPSLTVPTGNHTFNTDTGHYDGGPNPVAGWGASNHRLVLDTLVIQSGAALNVTGSMAFRVNTDSSITVAGTVDRSGVMSATTADTHGGDISISCGGSLNLTNTGALLSNGGNGGNGGSPAQAGGNGGAISLVGAGVWTIDGRIESNGGAGGAGHPGSYGGNGGNGGGGGTGGHLTIQGQGQSVIAGTVNCQGGTGGTGGPGGVGIVSPGGLGGAGGAGGSRGSGGNGGSGGSIEEAMGSSSPGDPGTPGSNG